MLNDTRPVKKSTSTVPAKNTHFVNFQVEEDEENERSEDVEEEIHPENVVADVVGISSQPERSRTNGTDET